MLGRDGRERRPPPGHSLGVGRLAAQRHSPRLCQPPPLHLCNSRFGGVAPAQGTRCSTCCSPALMVSCALQDTAASGSPERPTAPLPQEQLNGGGKREAEPLSLSPLPYQRLLEEAGGAHDSVEGRGAHHTGVWNGCNCGSSCLSAISGQQRSPFLRRPGGRRASADLLRLMAEPLHRLAQR